jgi:hypothetical protein
VDSIGCKRASCEEEDQGHREENDEPENKPKVGVAILEAVDALFHGVSFFLVIFSRDVSCKKNGRS